MEERIKLPPYKIEEIADEIRDEEIKDISGALETGKTEIDPVIFSIVLARLEGIMGEMTATVLATARNPILYSAKDVTCTVLNAKAKVLSIHDCLPVHVGTLSPALRWVIRAFKGDIREGDVFVNNASFAGNAHSGDWTMFAPVFYKGKFVVWVVNKAHLVDIGMHIPSTMGAFAKDVYEEGIHFPGVRLCSDHKMIPDLIRLIGYNFRYPRQWYGDFLAQLGSLWAGEIRVIELCDRFGYDIVKGCFEESLRYGDRMMTEEIKKLPRITVEEEMLSEKFEGYCPEGLRLRLRLSVDPDKALITFDYRDMPDQLPWGYNLTYATAVCSAIQGTLPVLKPALCLNDGAIDHIKVLLKEGSVAGIPHWPAGTSKATTGICEQVTNLVFKIWAKVVPARALAGMGPFSVAGAFCSGIDRRTNQPYTHAAYLAASAAGATEGYDGLAHMFGHCIMGNMGYESVELLELACPQIAWASYAIRDSGGPGKWRGGVAGGHRIQPRDHDMVLIFAGIGHTSGAFGLFGGQPGCAADHWIVDHVTGKIKRQLPNAGSTTVKADEEWVAVTGGGGGFGDPLERDPEDIRDDVRDGFVSIEAARDIYKVVIDTEPELYAVDYAATYKLRAEAKNREGQENGIQNKC